MVKNVRLQLISKVQSIFLTYIAVKILYFPVFVRPMANFKYIVDALTVKHVSEIE
jgi:hypothetical protein